MSTGHQCNTRASVTEVMNPTGVPPPPTTPRPAPAATTNHPTVNLAAPVGQPAAARVAVGIGGNDPNPPGGDGGGGGAGDGGRGDPNNGGGNGPPYAGQPVAPANNRPLFALTPAHTIRDIFDYSTKYGQQLYERLTAMLPTTFDGESRNVQTFAKEFAKKANESNWDDVLTINNPNNQAAPSFHLPKQYGQVNLDVLKLYALTYMGVPCRAFQVSFQVYVCLKASLAHSLARAIATQDEQNYLVNGSPDGLLYFMSIIAFCQTRTRGTIVMLLEKFSQLNKIMIQVDNNIKQFNMEVNALRKELLVRGERVSENLFMTNLIKGYLSCAYKDFTDFISRRRDEYTAGQPLTAHTLMDDAVNKYNWHVENNTWMEPTAEQHKIVTLTAEVQKLHKGINSKPPQRGEGRRQTQEEW